MLDQRALLIRRIRDIVFDFFITLFCAILLRRNSLCFLPGLEVRQTHIRFEDFLLEAHRLFQVFGALERRDELAVVQSQMLDLVADFDQLRLQLGERRNVAIEELSRHFVVLVVHELEEGHNLVDVLGHDLVTHPRLVSVDGLLRALGLRPHVLLLDYC